MRRLVCVLCVLSLLVLTSAVAQAGTISLGADRDLGVMGPGLSGTSPLNFGLAPTMWFGQAATYWDRGSSLLSFDVSGLAAGPIHAITLRMHVNLYDNNLGGPDPIDASVHAILASNKDWVEGSSSAGATQSGACLNWKDSSPAGDVAWASGGDFGSSDYSATVLANRSLGAADVDTYVDFTFSGTTTELTSLIDGWWTDNAGLVIRPLFTGVGTTAVVWDSSECAVAAYAPQLLVSGTNIVPEPSAIVLLISGLVGLLAYAWRKRK